MVLENDLEIMSTWKIFKNFGPTPGLKAPAENQKIVNANKTILDICTLYTVYKNLLIPHLIAPAALEKNSLPTFDPQLK